MTQMGRRSWISILALWFILSHFSMAFGEEFRYDSHGQRDPFVSPTRGVVESSGPVNTEIHLEGIVVDPKGGSVAIVNGQMLREGEVFQGLILRKVEENRALFEKHGEMIEAVLNQDDQVM